MDTSNRRAAGADKSCMPRVIPINQARAERFARTPRNANSFGPLRTSPGSLRVGQSGPPGYSSFGNGTHYSVTVQGDAIRKRVVDVFRSRRRRTCGEGGS